MSSDHPDKRGRRSRRDVPRVILIDHLAVGGGTTVAGVLAASWLARDLAVDVVTIARVWDGADDRLPADSLTVLGARGHLSSLRRLRRHLRDTVDRDGVLLSIGEYSALIAVLARAITPRLRRVRIVIAEHQPHSLATLFEDRRGPMGMLVPSLVRILRRRVAASICLSERQRQELIEADLTTEGRSVVIANPCVLPVVEGPVVAERIRRIAEGARIRMLAIGSYNAAKNHAMLLRVIAGLDPRFSLTIVGNGDPSELRALAEHLGVEDRIDLRAAATDVAQVMDEHDILVLPSRYESFGLVVIEAIVRGLPVVATTCNATLPVIAAGCDSLRLAPVDGDDAFRAAVTEWASTSWDVTRLLDNAMRLAAEHDPQRAVDQHLALFDALGRGIPLSTRAASAAR
jgi:glycosyltransferase involved in cell wall biosynthesis